jgi:predicted RNA-binding Zn ribbon-like protein
MLHGRGLGRIAKHLIPFLRTTVWPTMKETLAPIGKQFVNDIESGVPAKSAIKRSYTDLKGVIKRKLLGRGGGSRPKKRKATKVKSKKRKKKATIKKKKKSPKRKKKIIRKKTDFFADL